jgi:hypothetical protein
VKEARKFWKSFADIALGGPFGGVGPFAVPLRETSSS